jgi:Phage integrase, N-terminal SAM-like domain
VPRFHEYSSQWLQARIDGVTGEKPIRPTTAAKYRRRIESHILPFLAGYRLQEIDRDLCLAFKAHLLRESRELRESIEAGADIRDRNGRRVKPLSPASMRMVTDGLVAILDDAVEDGHIDSNPARGRRMRIKVPKPKRTFLEFDELAALIDAGSEQDISLGPGIAPIELSLTAAQVAQLHGQGKTPTQIATRLAPSETAERSSTSSFATPASSSWRPGRHPRRHPLGRSMGRKAKNRPPGGLAVAPRLPQNQAICRAFVSGRSRIRTWDLFLIREAL